MEDYQEIVSQVQEPDCKSARWSSVTVRSTTVISHMSSRLRSTTGICAHDTVFKVITHSNDRALCRLDFARRLP